MQRLSRFGFPVRAWRQQRTKHVYATQGQDDDDDEQWLHDEIHPESFPGQNTMPEEEWRFDPEPRAGEESWDYGLGPEHAGDTEVGPEGSSQLPNWAKAYPRRGKKVVNTE
eukprot:3600634-Amphidinium_carterae.1